MTLSFMQTLIPTNGGAFLLLFPSYPPPPFPSLHPSFNNHFLRTYCAPASSLSAGAKAVNKTNLNLCPTKHPVSWGDVNYTQNDKCCQWGLLWRNMKQKKGREILGEGSLSFRWHAQGRPLIWGKWGKSWQTAERCEGEHSRKRNSKCQLLF